MTSARHRYHWMQCVLFAVHCTMLRIERTALYPLFNTLCHCAVQCVIFQCFHSIYLVTSDFYVEMPSRHAHALSHTIRNPFLYALLFLHSLRFHPSTLVIRIISHFKYLATKKNERKRSDGIYLCFIRSFLFLVFHSIHCRKCDIEAGRCFTSEAIHKSE